MTADRRRGVSLLELLIATTMSICIGAAAASLLSTSTRFAERNEAQRAARLTARSAINVLVNDLRLIDPAWGVELASAQSVQVKAPYALAVVCDTNAKVTLAILPADSAAFFVPGYSGFGWRSTDGTYTVLAGGTFVSLAAAPASCAAAGIQAFAPPIGTPNEKTRYAAISATARTGIRIGAVVMLYRRVRFFFAPSAQPGLTGRIALWRDYLDDGATPVELVGPFDASAAFGFYVPGASAPQPTAPAALSTIRGFQLHLPGQSDNTPRQRRAPETADLTTSVFFINTAS